MNSPLCFIFFAWSKDYSISTCKSHVTNHLVIATAVGIGVKYWQRYLVKIEFKFKLKLNFYSNFFCINDLVIL